MAENMAVRGLRIQRARIAGEILQIEEDIARVLERLRVRTEQSHAQIQAKRALIAPLTLQITTLENAAQSAFGIDLGETIPRRTVPKQHILAWGALTRGILHELALADGTPLTSLQITHRLIVQLVLELHPTTITDLRRKIRCALKRLRRQGHVVRDASIGETSKHPAWTLASVA